MVRRKRLRGPARRKARRRSDRVQRGPTGHWSGPQGLEPPSRPAAVILGRLGGLQGRNSRAKSLTPEQRKAISKKAAQARWNRAKDTQLVFSDNTVGQSPQDRWSGPSALTAQRSKTATRDPVKNRAE